MFYPIYGHYNGKTMLQKAMVASKKSALLQKETKI